MNAFYELLKKYAYVPFPFVRPWRELKEFTEWMDENVEITCVCPKCGTNWTEKPRFVVKDEE